MTPRRLRVHQVCEIEAANARSRPRPLQPIDHTTMTCDQSSNLNI